MQPRKFRTLQAYMEATGMSSRRLLAKLRTETGHVISPAAFSYILRGSRRCSRYHATALSVITGIDMDDLTRWPKHADGDKLFGTSPSPTA